MTTSTRWTSADLETLPENGKRYEIIDGELIVSRQPHWNHQYVCSKVFSLLDAWDMQTKLGAANCAPGVIFADDEDVVPDVVWISYERLADAFSTDGHLHAAPEIVIEVLSPGSVNERRDREAKLKLYSRRGVSEYWIVDWRKRLVEVHRREEAQLKIISTLYDPDTLATPLLPGFACRVADIFEGILT
jgi:Uma2 family endonuclease